MKVVHCIWSFDIGGAENMLVDIMNCQSAKAEVHLIIINNVVNQRLIERMSPKVKIHRINRNPGSRSPMSLLRLNLLLTLLRPDIIHLHNSNLPEVIMPIIGAKKVMTVHDLNIKISKIKSIDKFYAISTSVQADLRERCNLNAYLVNNGICTQDIKMRSAKRFLNTLKMVQVGRLVQNKKGQDILIKAIRQLNDQGINNVTVTFIGNGPDLDSLNVIAHDLGVSDSVEFLGDRDREYVYEHLKDYDLMVHPARYEGFGLTVPEAMVAGLPVAVPNQGGPYEVCDYGRLATVFDSDDVESCAQAIKKIYMDYDQALSRLTEAREWVQDKYSIECTAENYLQLYR